ncbi:nitrate transporter 1.12 [Hibiscus trionum]|uniref:Nitrate transporter 1.12 n=1 Tax=Hibiscus trionum TaxID=183268 RepID=A0A9W7M5H7_HIBTR|nr:nitrate transporter 1.12 [Hibiscus trionum]
METPSDGNDMITEPLLTSHASKGGFRTLPFILATEAFERVATVGISPNMIVYLTREFGMETVKAANIIFFWSAATNFFPIIGAFLADSYLGKYRMIGFGSMVCFLGMVLLWLTAMIPQARPYCDQFSTICEAPTTLQLLLLYCSLGLISVGAGGIRSSCMAFGADQLDTRNNPESARALQSFFSWFYVTVSFSCLVAVTFIVYIQDNMGWKMGFGVAVMLMLVSALSFFLASSFYIKLKAKASLFTGFAQVMVASFRNRHIELPSHATNEAYYLRKGSMLQVPSEKLRFLNKACVIKDPQWDLTSNGTASNPWNLCTIDQVENLKALLGVMPLCSAGIMLSVTVNQGPFTVILAGNMDRHITPNFEIPAGSFSMFLMISLVVWIPFYDRIALPLASKIKGKPVRLTLKQRMGIGLLCSCASIASLAIVEYTRRNIAIQGLSDGPQAPVHMSALWLLPHYALSGLAEAFNGIGQIEFCYSELPKTMSTIAANINGLGFFFADLVASLITNTVDSVSKRGGESWISSNVNKGHYDYYFCLVAGLSVLNFMYFLACSKAYGPCRGEIEKKAEISRKEDHEKRIDDC